MKLKKIISVILVSVMVLATACSGNDSNNKKTSENEILGEINYQAKNVLIEPGTDELGETLDYREILNLEEYALSSEKPVLLCVKRDKLKNMNVIIPWMEEMAHKYRGSVNVVMAEDDSNEELFYYLDYQNVPTIFLLYDGEVVRQASWEEEDGLQILVEKMQELVK